MFNNNVFTKFSIILRSIWLFFAVPLWNIGLGCFIYDPSFEMYMAWGVISCMLLIVPVIRNTFFGTTAGAISGSRRYNVYSYGGRIYIENHPFLGAVIGFIISLFLNLLVGPVLMVYYLVTTITYVIKGYIRWANRSI